MTTIRGETNQLDELVIDNVIKVKSIFRMSLRTLFSCAGSRRSSAPSLERWFSDYLSCER